ncbi:MAG: response regulator [Lachnospiraceae bacterium]|nr:response regulator [Lachnospiraceae bacterium]
MHNKNSLQTIVLRFATIVILIIAFLLGGMCFGVLSKDQKVAAWNILASAASSEATAINENFVRMETSVNDVVALADNSIHSIQDVKDEGVRQKVTSQMSSIFIAIMKRSEDIFGIYISYDPALIGGSDGVFYTRNSRGNIQENELTDITKYSEDDIEHVGWFSIPKATGEPVWLEPYYNKNVDRWLISYVVPFYKDGEMVAVIGVDMDFEKLVKVVDQARVYERGYAFLKNSDGMIHYHPAFFNNDIHGDDKVTVISEGAVNISTSGEEIDILEYMYNGERSMGAVITLRSGLKLVMCDDYMEVYHDRNSLLMWTMFSELLITLIVIFLVRRACRRLINPIVEITGSVKEIDAGNYDIEIPEMEIEELAELQNGINKMTKTLAKKKKLTESELAARNRKLERAVEEAQRASQAKSDFLSQMSHDIRTPMNAIVGMSIIANDNINNPDKLADCLDKINNSGKYLMSLINNVLDMSRIESGTFAFSMEENSIRKLIDNTVRMVNSEVEGHNHIMKTDVSHVVHDMVIVDGLRLQQVFVNILSNSIKYTNDGGVITVIVKEEPGTKPGFRRYIFMFTDNGIGMSPEFLEKIYTPFVREKDEHQTEVKGTGLGMAITKAIVDNMGGCIDISSELGVGTEVKIVFELKVINQDNSSDSTEGSMSSGLSEVDLSGKRILVVDDMIINLEIAAELLEATGAIVEKAGNGREAVDKFKDNPDGYFDLILMDIRMPIMNGYEASRSIRGMGSDYSQNIPIVAMSADAFEEDKRKSKESGMNDHIAKPLDIDHLIEVLQKL